MVSWLHDSLARCRRWHTAAGLPARVIRKQLRTTSRRKCTEGYTPREKCGGSNIKHLPVNCRLWWTKNVLIVQWLGMFCGIQWIVGFDSCWELLCSQSLPWYFKAWCSILFWCCILRQIYGMGVKIREMVLNRNSHPCRENCSDLKSVPLSHEDKNYSKDMSCALLDRVRDMIHHRRSPGFYLFPYLCRTTKIHVHYNFLLLIRLPS